MWSTGIMGIWCKAILATGGFYKVTVKCTKGAVNLNENDSRLRFGDWKAFYMGDGANELAGSAATRVLRHPSLTLVRSGELFFKPPSEGDTVKIDFVGHFLKKRWY